MGKGNGHSNHCVTRQGTQPVLINPYKHWLFKWLFIRFIRILYEFVGNR